MTEPRTVNHILSDLLRLVVNDEWSGEVNVVCHCHPQYVECCKECKTTQYKRGTSIENEHKPDCARYLLIKEARAYLEVENKLADERGDYDSEVNIP